MLAENGQFDRNRLWAQQDDKQWKKIFRAGVLERDPAFHGGVSSIINETRFHGLINSEYSCHPGWQARTSIPRQVVSASKRFVPLALDPRIEVRLVN